ncbi:copper amine oxidase N-terminal domain-containing protein [Caldinitratiruptor microaerophilus]|uniref:Copper amine oxidase-like N-terminal domain-containing protein n=1 Tax=Caldinitratiruptor microaerophilus TaxID=671077 RepID=A0AA35G8Y4_9FIRM|nr:copper amine oxidase N-terminal domain-containing protein [Caldinitratiruptor microaerophilus]BDG61535.1 hypothetical protein caldi_26250 [Caldinitratiruptor microaerophilus]
MAVVAAVLLVGGAAFAQGATFQGLPVVSVYVNGRFVQSDVPAVILGGRTMVPLRAVSEALGAQVLWDDSTKTVAIALPADARLQFCQTFNQAQPALTLQGWAQYVQFCGSDPAKVKLNVPDARLQFCQTFGGYVQQGSTLTLDAWRMYTALCGSKAP